MKLVVDTSVWSLAFRRRKATESPQALLLREFIENGERIFLIGVILQEILSGIRDRRVCARLSDELSAFPLIPLGREDYVAAAELGNRCRSRGVQASTIDFLIAAVCLRHELSLFTTDRDFQRIAGMSELKLIAD